MVVESILSSYDDDGDDGDDYVDYVDVIMEKMNDKVTTMQERYSQKPNGTENDACFSPFSISLMQVQ